MFSLVSADRTKSGMEKKLCGECQLPINEIEPACCGLCETHFHIGQQCCGFNSRAHRDLFSLGKAVFICPTCKDELNGRSIRAYFTEKLETKPVGPSNAATTDQFHQLCETVGALSEKVDRLMLSQNRSDSPIVPAWPRLGVKRRRGDNGQTVRKSADRGTNSIDFSDLSITSIIPAPPPVRWWLYLSGFLPTITDADVKKIVSRCLDLGDDNTIEVIRLVAKGTDVSKLTFVSFKIGVDPCFKQQALLASSWPAGILFREFIDMSKNRIGGPVTTGANPPDAV